MNGQIVQLVALVTYANAGLKGRWSGQFFPNHASCIFCERVTFGNCPSPDAWFEQLATRGAVGLRLRHEAGDDPMLAGFVNSGRRSIEAVMPGGMSQIWSGSWRIGDRDRNDRRIWQVDYSLIDEAATRTSRDRPVAEVTADFRTALIEIRDFALCNGLANFVPSFSTALEALDGRYTQFGTGNSLYPQEDLPVEAANLLNAAGSAWVFGGMGSWNDSGGGQDYDLVTSTLYATINRAIDAGANASFLI